MTLAAASIAGQASVPELVMVATVPSVSIAMTLPARTNPRTEPPHVGAVPGEALATLVTAEPSRAAVYTSGARSKAIMSVGETDGSVPPVTMRVQPLPSNGLMAHTIGLAGLNGAPRSMRHRSPLMPTTTFEPSVLYEAW